MLRKRIGALAVLVCLGGAPAAAAFKNVEEGQAAPEFALKTLGGGTVRLGDVLGPKALAVVFWATWSPRSEAMLDGLEALRKLRGEQGFAVLAVNVEHEVLSASDREAIGALAARWSFPVLLDEGLVTYSRYGVMATPTLALLDSTGILRYSRASYSSSAEVDIREAVDGLLGLGVTTGGGPVAAKRREYVPPKKATLHYQKAVVLVERGMGRRAVRDLEQAAELDPAWADPRVLLGRIHLAEGDPAKAEEALRQARAIQPRQLPILGALAGVLARRGRHEEAIAVAEEALGVESGYVPAHLAKARGLRALGRREEAKVVVEEALELDPRSAALLAERGELAAAGGDLRGAAEALRQAVEVALAPQEGEG